MIRRLSSGLALAVVLLGLAREARAVVGKVGTAGNDTIYVGCVDTGAGKRLQWCKNGTIAQIFTSCTMSDDVWIAGDDGDDTIIITYTNSTYFNNLDCGDGVSRDWDPPVFNGHYLDLYGENDDDTVRGSSGDTWLTGDAGVDFVKNFGSIGYNEGDSNNDHVISASTGGGETLNGGTGNDCVDDRSGTYSYFTCGSGTDSGTANPDGTCESTVTCCEALSCGYSGPQGESLGSLEEDDGGMASDAAGRGGRH